MSDRLEYLRRAYNAAIANGLVLTAKRIERELAALEARGA